MVGYIYLNTDLKTGNQYVGQHHYHLEKLDPNYHGSGVLWTKVLKKRPKELIKEEYIKTCYSEEEMNSDEQYYIEFFDTLYPNGYNLTEGGNGGLLCEETKHKISEAHKGKPSPNKGKTMSEEQKKKMSESQKGKHHSEETKKKMSISRKGRTSPNKGKTMSEETKKKISESIKGRTPSNKGTHISEETRRKISNSLKGRTPYNKGKHLSEETKKKISEAQKGIQHSEETKKKISESLKGKPKSEEHKKKLSESIKGKPNEKLSKKVLQLSLSGDLIREWPSASECGRNGFSLSAVSRCCNGKLPHYKGFKWCYAEE